MVFELRPGSLEAGGPGDRAAQARRGAAAGVRRSRSSSRSATSRGSRPAPATQVLRIAQEALGNALRHSAAKRIAVKLGGDDERLFLTVTDDGCGFDPAGPEVRGQRLGLTSMEERATELGGTLTVDLEARRGHDRRAWSSPRDPRPARRRPRRGAPGPAHVPRPPGRHRGRRRGGRRRGRGRRRRAHRPGRDPARPRDAAPRRRRRAQAPARDPRADHRAHQLRRRRQALRRPARGRRGLPAQGRRAAPSWSSAIRAAARRQHAALAHDRHPRRRGDRPRRRRARRRSTTSPRASATC